MLTLVLALRLLQTPIDEGTFVIRSDSGEVAREVFSIRVSRLSAGGAGWVLAATVRYDRARPIIVLSPILEVAQDSQPVALQYDVADPRAPLRILGQLGRGRFTVRMLARATEKAREFPAPARTIILDDSVFAFYEVAAWFSRPTPSTVTAIVPRGGRRETLTVVDEGIAATTVNRDPVSLRHVTLTGGANQQVHLWLTTDSHLLRIEIPSRHLIVERLPAS